MINELNEAMLNRIGQETAGEIIENLIYYTDTHFKTEEDLFEEYNYPESNTHKQEHADFVKKVTEFQNDFNSGKIGLSVFLLDFLKNWLISHIIGVDKKYMDFFQSKNVR